MRTDVAVVATELVTRAVYDCAGNPRLGVVLTSDEVQLTVDSTTMFGDSGWGPSSPLLAGTLVGRLCRQWGVEQGQGGVRQWGVVPRRRGADG